MQTSQADSLCEPGKHNSDPTGTHDYLEIEARDDWDIREVCPSLENYLRLLIEQAYFPHHSLAVKNVQINKIFVDRE